MNYQELSVFAQDIKVGDKIWTYSEWVEVYEVAWKEPLSYEPPQTYFISVKSAQRGTLKFVYRYNELLSIRRPNPKPPKEIPLSLPERARFEVVSYHNAHHSRLGEITMDQTFVVWFSKVLQNWKALVGTILPEDTSYYEITHNGDKDETYIDVYAKMDNVALKWGRNEEDDVRL
jgi:Family of unknown function (DUF6275)